MAEDEAIWRDMNAQSLIFNAMNRAIAARQASDKGSSFKKGVAGVWLSLFPRLKRKLAKKIGDGEFNERYYDDLLDEIQVEAGDNFEESTRKNEQIFMAIQGVMEDEGLLFDVDKRMKGHD